MRVKLLHDAGSDLKGAVIEMDDRRAQRLIATGYAVAIREIRETTKKAKE